MEEVGGRLHAGTYQGRRGQDITDAHEARTDVEDGREVAGELLHLLGVGGVEGADSDHRRIRGRGSGRPLDDIGSRCARAGEDEPLRVVAAQQIRELVDLGLQRVDTGGERGSACAGSEDVVADDASVGSATCIVDVRLAPGGGEDILVVLERRIDGLSDGLRLVDLLLTVDLRCLVEDLRVLLLDGDEGALDLGQILVDDREVLLHLLLELGDLRAGR